MAASPFRSVDFSIDFSVDSAGFSVDFPVDPTVFSFDSKAFSFGTFGSLGDVSSSDESLRSSNYSSMHLRQQNYQGMHRKSTHEMTVANCHGVFTRGFFTVLAGRTARKGIALTGPSGGG